MADIPPVSYSSKIDASRTIAEIHDLLVRAGAQRIATSYDEGVANGISFALTTEAWGVRVFELPVDASAMHRRLVKLYDARKVSLSRVDAYSMEQAVRVAWRVTKMWLASQLSLIETGMMPLEQVMFPHLKVGSFESPTVYQLASERPEMLAIEG